VVILHTDNDQKKALAGYHAEISPTNSDPFERLPIWDKKT
jgi:hypothetical protein